jgi:hypothetical protein
MPGGLQLAHAIATDLDWPPQSESKGIFRGGICLKTSLIEIEAASLLYYLLDELTEHTELLSKF